MPARLFIEITDDRSLSVASDLLHDAVFTPDDIVYDTNQRVFRLVMRREVPELARRRRVIPFIYRIDMPRMACELKICSVKEASVQATDGIGLGEYCLEEIRYAGATGVLRFEIMGPLKLELAVEQLCGELRDIGEITNGTPSTPWTLPSWRP